MLGFSGRACVHSTLTTDTGPADTEKTARADLWGVKVRRTRLPKNVYKRGDSYYVDVRVNGERIRKAAGTTVAEAIAEIERLRGESKATRPRQTVDRGPLFDTVLDRYLRRSELYSKPASYQSAESSGRRLREYFGGRPVSALGPDDVQGFIALRLESVSREAVNKDLRYLKAALRLALEEEQIRRLPFRVRLLKTTRKLPTILGPKELRRLFETAGDRLRPMLMTAAMSGLRHSELIALDWSDLDLRSRVLSVRAKPGIGFSPKSHAERQVPINPALAEELAAHRRRLRHAGPNDPVFQRNLKRASRWEPSALCDAVKQVFEDSDLYKAELRPGLHMLRRSFASHALAGQADIETVRELGGWSDLGVVQRYVASTQALKRKAVDALDFA